MENGCQNFLKKGKQRIRWLPFEGSNYFYISGIRAFGALGGFEFNLVTLLQGFEPSPRDCRVVNKHIFISFHFNKSKTLLIVEPFYSSSCHKITSIRIWVKIKNPSKRETHSLRASFFSKPVLSKEFLLPGLLSFPPLRFYPFWFF